MSDYSPRFSGERVDPNRCRAGVWSGYRDYQCSKKPTRDGYCGTHHPDAQKRRDAEGDAKYAAKRARWRREADIESARAEVLRLALEDCSPSMSTTLRNAVERLRALLVPR